METKHTIPEQGHSAGYLMETLQSLKSADARWDQGKVFGFVYHPGPRYARLSEAYLNAFLHENTLNPNSFPSLKNFEKDVTQMAVELMHGNSRVAGNITSGGSESIFLALKVARDTAIEKGNHTLPLEVVIPETAHPAFLKACHYLALKPVIIPVAEDKRADVIAMKAAITDRSILMVCSAPCFPYGVVDPVRKLAEVASRADMLLHVDACMGGFLLPFLEDLDYPVPEFDFRIRGVSSISLDAHKYGYAPKGVSVILYKNRKLRRKQFFVHPDWPGGIFASTTFMGTKSGGPLAGCWAVMKHLGRDGYSRIAAQLMHTTRAITEGIEKHKDLHVIGNPHMSVLSFTSDAGDILQVGDALQARGWHLDYLQFPDALHLTITPLNIGKETEFVKDLGEILQNKKALRQESRTAKSTVKAVRTLSGMLPDTSFDWLTKKAGNLNKGDKGHRMAALYGISASLKNRNKVSKLVHNLLDGLY